MRILIVEDNAFNGYCLRRLLESVVAKATVTIANNSQAALSWINASSPDMVVIEGDLGAAQEGHCCNGPELANLLLKKFPHLPVIAWSDSAYMREAFTLVFKQHHQSFNEYNSWTKAISLERICKTWAYYFGEFMAGQSEAFANQSNASCR